MKNTKKLTWFLLFFVICNVLVVLPSAYAGPVKVDPMASTVSDSSAKAGNPNIIERLFQFLYNLILGPILNTNKGGDSGSTLPGKGIPLPPGGSDNIRTDSLLKGKTIVLDPGHGGSNPGAVQNNTRESDVNLAVAAMVRSKLMASGAKVVMTRDSDRSVAANGSTLGQELQARLDITNKNKADIFVSIHSNSNSDNKIAGTMTFYPSGGSSKLASAIQNAVILETGAIDKGIVPGTFYVLRNNSVPSVLIEMGFLSNYDEAMKLQSSSYQKRLAEGIYRGIVNYFNGS